MLKIYNYAKAKNVSGNVKVNYKIHKTINDTVIFLVYQKECKLYPLKETNHYRVCGHNVCFDVIKE
ncbi:MAG: hypothetical protein OHK0036_08280 [Bacteroidia bacterium]